MVAGVALFVANGQRYSTAAPGELDTAIPEYEPLVDHATGAGVGWKQKERKLPTFEVDMFIFGEQSALTIAQAEDLNISIEAGGQTYLMFGARNTDGFKLNFAEGKTKLMFMGNLELPS